jgi:hypothetical protein
MWTDEIHMPPGTIDIFMRRWFGCFMPLLTPFPRLGPASTTGLGASYVNP